MCHYVGMRGIFNFKNDIRADRAGLRLMCATLALAAVPLTASAAAMITEVMYDAPGTDTGREWIEVQNTGDAAIDLSTWKLFEANTNHKIAAIGQTSLPMGGFAVIADSPDKFRADYPNFAGLLFDSTFSLSNSGETLTLRDDSGADADSLAYLPEWGAAGDGSSLQKSAAGTWIAVPVTLGLPTTAMESMAPSATAPGEASSTPSTSPLQASQDKPADDASVHSAQEPINVSIEKPEFQVTIGRPRIGFVGSPLVFEAQVKTARDIPRGNSIRSSWAMGDGTELFGQWVAHAYSFPGEYVIVANSDANGMHAVSKTLVRILVPNIKIGLIRSGAIEVSNLDAGEINVGGFIVEDSSRRFILPRDTIIEPRSSIKLSGGLTNIGLPRDFIRIADPAGNILSTASLNGGDSPVILPPGLDAQSLRERLLQALKYTHEK